MPAQLQRVRLRPRRGLGRYREIMPERAKDEDLDFFFWISKRSRRAISNYIDNLLGPP